MRACWVKGKNPEDVFLCPHLKFTVRRDYYEKIPARFCELHRKYVPDEIRSGEKPGWCREVKEA